MEKSRNKNVVNRTEKLISGFFREHVVKNLSVVVLVILIVGVSGIYYFRKNGTVVSIIIFMMTQSISAAIMVFQLRLNATKDFRNNLSWNTYEILSKAYECVGQLDIFEFQSVDNAVNRIKNNPGVIFKNMIVSKPENSYMVEYRKSLGELISNIYSIVIPVTLRLSVYLKDHDLEKIESVMEKLKKDIKSMKKLYTESEEIWVDIYQKQYKLKDIEVVREQIKEKKKELKSAKENKAAKDKITKRIHELEDRKAKYKINNDEISKDASGSYEKLKNKYDELYELAEDLAKDGGNISKFEEQLKETIRDNRKENKFFDN